MNNFFKNSDFNFFTNKPSIFFDILRGKELYFSKRYHLSRLKQVFISKFHVKVIATVVGHAVCIRTEFHNVPKYLCKYYITYSPGSTLQKEMAYF